jgi:F0F1-type ATP synthase gamma subunit
VRGTSSKDECLIIGTTGREVWRSATKKRKQVEFVTFADDTPNAQETRDFLGRIQPYEHVYVFFPGFVSVYQQRATMVDITFRPTKTSANVHEMSDLPEYFLEPDIREMFAFFSTQVRFVLFERMLLETELSRVSARLVRMDVADHNAALMLKREQHELSRAYNSFANSRMLETLLGFTQWHRTKL